jgi:hypothetical protein
MLTPMSALRLSCAVVAVVAVLAAAVALDACGQPTEVYQCNFPTLGELGADGGADPCHCNIPGDSISCPCKTPSGQADFQECMSLLADAGEGGPISGCLGQCLPSPPTGWSSPVLLWFGSETAAPACPESAAGVGYEGHADPTTMSLPCGACSCESPTGTCGLPLSVTASAAPCAVDAGSPSTPFDGPAAWDGGCTTHDALDAGAKSVTISPLLVTEGGCTPMQAPVQTNMPGLWNTFARDCTSSAGGTCASTGETCAPTAPDGFEQCVFFLAEGDTDCPSASFSPYTEKHVFFGGANDMRQCSPCTCTSETGTCSAMLSVYSDGACGSLLASDTITSTMPLCFGLPDLALGSKSVGPVTYTPGTCQPSGGESMGSVVPLMPSTFCCLPPL